MKPAPAGIYGQYILLLAGLLVHVSLQQQVFIGSIYQAVKEIIKEFSLQQQVFIGGIYLVTSTTYI